MDEFVRTFCWVAAWGAVVTCSVFALTSWRRRGPALAWETLGFFAAAMICIAAFRAPILHVPFELHPDVSQLISGAMTLRHDPVFWRAVDGHTSGPLNHYALVAPIWLGGERAYFAARVFGLGMVAIMLASGIHLARRVFSPRVALPGMLPIVVFFAAATHPEHVHYSSEHLPMALLAVGLFGLARFVVDGGRLWLAFAGFVLAATPFAKLQAAPIALTIFLSAAVLALRPRALAPLLAGAGLLALIFVAYATTFGLWRDIKLAYLDANLSWVGASRPRDPGTLVTLVGRVFHSFGALPLCAAVAGAALLLAFRIRREPSGKRWFQGLAVATALATLGSIVNTGQGSQKYFLLCIPALSLLGPAVVGALEEARDTSRGWVGPAGVAVFLALGVAWPLAARMGVSSAELPHYPHYRPAKEADTVAIVAELERWLHPGDPLALWTAPPELYVRAQCRQATRDGETSRQMLANPEREYFRARYLADIQASQPRVLLDGSSVYRRGFEPEGFPEFADYLRRHYRLEKEIAGRRVFVRTDDGR